MEPCRFQSLEVALLPSTCIAHVRRAADQSDSLVTDSRQMLYSVESSQLIIGLDQIGFETRTGAHEQDDRNIGVGEHHSLRSRQRTGCLIQDDAVDSLRDQQFEIQRLFVLLV